MSKKIKEYQILSKNSTEYHGVVFPPIICHLVAIEGLNKINVKGSEGYLIANTETQIIGTPILHFLPWNTTLPMKSPTTIPGLPRFKTSCRAHRHFLQRKGW